MQTIREHFGVSLLTGLKLAFIGDGNNVAQSLMLTGLRLGMDFALACPPGYLPNPDIVTQAGCIAAVTGARLGMAKGLGTVSSISGLPASHPEANTGGAGLREGSPSGAP